MQEMFTITDPQNQWAAFAGADNDARLCGTDHGDGEGTP